VADTRDESAYHAQRREHVDSFLAYHSDISRQLTSERTSLESQLIPVSAYIITSCIEALLRYPEIMNRIDEAMPADEIGRRARRPGCRVNTVHLWSISNLPLVGRKVFEAISPDQAHDVSALATIADFWERAALAYRADGTRQAWDTNTVTPYDGTIVDALLAGVTEVDDELRSRVKRFNATLVSYLFLLYFDTRVGAGDTGPYPLPDGRVLLVRDYYQMAQSDFPWSDVAAGVPYQNLTAAFVLAGVTIDRITDFGTSNTTPEDYLDHVVGFALYSPDPVTGALTPVALDELDGIVKAVRAAQSAHYRNIAKMTRDEKIRAGAYVYFSFLRPFAIEAGIEDQIDWTVPRDIDPVLYQMVSMMEGDNTGIVDEGPYYSPLPSA
jgi:hypothetical protein